MEGVDMNCLTETERDAILSVIRRNDQLQQAEQQRVSKLQSEVKFIRLKGVIKPGQDAAKSCARCRTPFGWFFNTGTICTQCQHRVCDTCQVPLEQPGKWLCVLCHKQMQLQAMTGDWFYSKFRKSKRHKRTNKVITGSEIVRTSIHRPNRPNRLTSCDTTATGAANSIGQEVKRVLSNNNASPQSKQPPNTSADGESSDTQSMEDSYSPRRQLQKDLEGTAYPRDSDRQKLLNLIRPKMSDSEFANGRNTTGTQPQVKIEVKHIPSSRYCDSDSSSDSETTNPSPPPFSRTTDPFLNSESVRSSFRSTVSAISSEGPNTVVTEGISDLDIPTCSSASVSPTIFRKDVTAPSYHKDTQNERLYDSDKSRSNPSSSLTDGLLGISPTQSRNEIDDEKQPKQVVRRSLTKQDSLAVDSSDSEGEFTTEQITRMKFRRISVSKIEGKTSSPRDQNSREGASSTEPPDTPPQPEVINTDHDPSPTLELTDSEPALTPELSHSLEAVAVIPCVEVEPSVEPSELEPEPELSTTETEEGAESLCGQQGWETGGVFKGGDGDTSPPDSSFLQHGGGGGVASGSVPETSHTNFTPSMGVFGSGTSSSKAPPGEGLVSRKEPLMASPADTNPTLQSNNEKDSDYLLHSATNSPLSTNVSSVCFDATHSGSCEVRGEGEASALALGNEENNAESSESTIRVSSTRERVGALLARLGRTLSQNEGNTVDGKANEVIDDDTSSNSTFDDITAPNEDFDDLEWDSGLVPGQTQISELEATSTNVVLMRELRTTGPIRLGLHEFDHDTDVNLCRSAYKSADTHGDLLDDDVGQQGVYYACVNDDDLATGGYSGSCLDPNLLNINQDSYSDRLSIISERTEPQDYETDDGDSESDECFDDPSSSLNTTVIMQSKQEEKPSEELVAGMKDSGNRNKHLSGTEISQLVADKVKDNLDEVHVKETSVSNQATAVVSEANTNTKARPNQHGKISQEGDERRRPFPLVKQDTLSRLALEAESTDIDDTLDLSLMVESNAAYADDDEVFEKSDRLREDTTDASKQAMGASKKAQVTADNDKKGVTMIPPVEVVKKEDTKVKSPPVLVNKEDAKVKSPTTETVTEVWPQKGEQAEPVSTQMPDVTRPTCDESAESSKRYSVLERRDTITTMALEAIEDGSGDGDDDLANVVLQNKQYVTDMEVASIMSEAVVGTENTGIAKTTEKPHLPKDNTQMTTSTPIKVQKSSRPPRSKQMSDSKQDIRKPSRGGRDEAVDTSHALSMSQLMKVFNQPQKFMVPKVAEAYCQKEADHCRDEETDEQTVSHQKEALQESLQPLVDHSGHVGPEPGSIVASVVSADESGHVKQDRTVASVVSAEHGKQERNIASVMSTEETKHVKQERTVASVMSSEESEHVKQQQTVASVVSAEESEHVKQQQTVASVVSSEESEHVKQQQTVASVVSSEESEHVKQQQTVASVVSSEESEHVKQQQTVASVVSAEHVKSAEHMKQERTVASVILSEEREPVKQERAPSESQVKAKQNNQDSRQSNAESDEDSFVDVKYVEPKAGDKELDLHVSFHELDAESSTDGTMKGIGKCADDIASCEEEERSNLERELKSTFGVLDEESVTDNVTSHVSHKVFLRVPSIVVTLADGTAAEDWAEEVTHEESIEDATDAAKESEPNVVQPSANTDPSFMSVLQGIMLADDKDTGGHSEEAEDTETEHHHVGEMEKVEESEQGGAGTDMHNDTVMANVEEAQEEDADMNEVEETLGESVEIEKKNNTTSGFKIETVIVTKVEDDDEMPVDLADKEQQSDTAETEVADNIVSADRQLKQSPLMLIDEKDSARDSEDAWKTENERDDIAEGIEKNIAEDENQNVTAVEKVEESVEEIETNIIKSSVNTDASFTSVLQGIMLTDDKGSRLDTEEPEDVDFQTANHNVVVVKEVDETTKESENQNDTKSETEIETTNVTVTGKDDKPLANNPEKVEQNDSTEKTTEGIDSADLLVKPTSLASPDTTVVDTCKRRSNLEIFLNTGHPPDPNDPPPVEGANATFEGQPTLLSLANQLAVTLVKGIIPESDASPASQHASPPPTDSPPAQSSTMATEMPTEESKHNGRISSSLKSATQESENHNSTGCDAEVDIVVTHGGSDDTRPRSPSSIPSPAMMHSKRALEGVCELDEDRQSSDSYSVTPRTDSPSSMSSHYSRGQQSNRSTNLLTPFSVSTESMMSYYSDAGEGNYGKIPVTGEIQFGLDYNYKNSVFEVAIRQCKDIAAVDTKKKRSDPYVKTYLLPDRTKNGKRKTRVKKHTLNPVFDEILKYHVTKSELETRTLWVTIWHNDTFGRNDFLGEVTLPLDYYEFGDSSAQWYKLQERNPLPLSLLTYKGDLNLSLRFVTPENLPGRKKDGRCGSNGSLHVLIKQARNLTAVRANGSSDPFCKGYLLPDKIRRIKQKTPVLKKNCNPTWNYTMVFDNVSWDELGDYCLELTIWDYDRFTSNDFLGGVRLNLGSGKNGGREVDWMDAKGDEISIWQSMLDRPNYWIDGTLMVRPNMDRRK